MKNVLLILIMPLSLAVYAQEESKQNEIGLTFRNLDNFGITYRTGNAKALWRFNSVIASGNNEKQTADSTETTHHNSGFSVSVGKEFRKPIKDNFTFRYGADVSFGYSKYLNKTNDKSIDNNDNSTERFTYGPGVNLVLGLNYKIGDSFMLGVELLPSINYVTGTSKTESQYFGETESDISAFSYGLTNTSALLSLVYVF